MKLPDVATQNIEDGMGIPTVLRFVPTSCSIVVNEYQDGSVPPMIAMGVQLDKGQTVRSTDGKDMRKVGWTLAIYRGAASRDHLKAKAAIGMVNYNDEYESIDLYVEESCYAWAHIPESSFSIFLDFVMSGRMPRRVDIHAFGSIRYGWEPDGSSKEWDLDSEKPAYISQIELHLDLNEKVQEDEVPEELIESPTSKDFLDFEHRLLERIRSHVLSVNMNLGWIVLLLLVLVVRSFLKS